MPFHTDFTWASARPTPVWLAALAVVLAVIAVAPQATAAAGVPAHGRAWELVTPPDPNGVGVQVGGVDATGERVVIVTSGAARGAPAAGLENFVFATRGADGWTGGPIGYPFTATALSFNHVVLAGVADDYRSWWWQASTPLLPGAPPEPRTAAYRAVGADPDGPLALMADLGNSVRFRAVSDDGQRAVFDVDSAPYEVTDRQVRPLGVDGGGGPLGACGTWLGRENGSDARVISQDGSRVYLRAKPCSGPTRVYLRDGDAAPIEISASACTRLDCAPPGATDDVAFMGTTPDGSTAFLETRQQLTNDDFDNGHDLYRYDVGLGVLTRVSAGSRFVPANMDTQSPVVASDDGERVYFVAPGALVPGAANGSKVYLADHGDLRLVARHSLASPIWGDGEAPWVSADGDRLVIETTAAFTGDDVDGVADIYLYDASDDAITRVTRGPAGGNGPAPVDLLTGGLHGMQPSAVSDDGTRVFFTTTEALLPEDVNGANDVYEWADGSLGLVTSGEGVGAIFDGASPDGSGVFFTTTESLVAADDDSGDEDVYVARLGGGFPDPPASSPPAPKPLAPARRLNRRTPASLRGPTGAGRLRVARPGATALRRAAARGRLTLRVTTGARARLRARAYAEIAGRSRTVARASAVASAAGVVRLVLPLSPATRRALTEGGRLRLAVVVSRPLTGAQAKLTLTLRRPR